MGSGRELKQDIHKLGRENFKREILFDFDNFTDMDNKEKELVTEEFIAREDTYNIRIGGQNSCLSDINSIERKKFYFLLKTNKEFRKRFSQKVSEVVKRGHSNHPERYKAPPINSWWFGRHHTDETKRKIRIKNSLRLSGENNTFYGKRWVSDMINEISYPQDKSIPLEDFQISAKILNFAEYQMRNADD